MRILHKDIDMTPYKVQLVQKLKPIDHPMRFHFAKWACVRFTEDADFAKKKNIFSDEAHCDLGGYINKQYCRIWRTENPHAYTEKPTHPKRVTVWCGHTDIIGPFCFENEQGEAVTVSNDRYRAMLSEFLFTKIEEEDIGNIWFQEDGATCHTVEAALDVLRPVFEDRIISRRTDVVWPPRSCDLDYYLWGAVKDKCYANKSETIDALKDNIREAIAEIQLHTIYNMLKNLTDRVGYCTEGITLQEITRPKLFSL